LGGYRIIWNNGGINDIHKVIVLTGNKIEAFSNQRMLIDMDVEQPGILPIVIDMLPGALQIITRPKAFLKPDNDPK